MLPHRKSSARGLARLQAWGVRWREARKSRFVADSLATGFEFQFRLEVARYIRTTGDSIVSLIDTRYGPMFINALGRAAEAGWVEGGGLMADFPGNELAAINDVQLGALPGFRQFVQDARTEYRKLIEAGEMFKANLLVESVKGRIGLWANSIRGTYNYFMALARGRTRAGMVTWNLGAAEKHCADCPRLHGQRHSMEWFRSRGYIPGQPGAAQACGGYRCQCYFTNDAGEVVTA